MSHIMKRLFSITLCAILLIGILPVPGNASNQNNSVMPRAVFQWGPESFALVGSGLPGIQQWDPADPAGDMEKVNYSYFDYEIVLEVTAGTSMSFKFAGNDQWDEEWTFGGSGLVIGQPTDLVQGSGSNNLQLSVTEDCLLRFTVDFNAYYAGEGNATVLVTKVNPPSFRSLKVHPPYDWSKVYVYSDDSQFLSPSPGSLVPEVSYYHEMMIPVDVCNLVISGITKDGRMTSTQVITLEDNLRDVYISVDDDSSYSLWYERLEERVYRITGNAPWMGDSNTHSDAGLLEEVSPGVFEKTTRNVAPGSYWFWITKDGSWNDAIGETEDTGFSLELPQACDVTVRYTLPFNQVVIALNNLVLLHGDASTDGRVNIGDVSRLYAHVRGSSVMKQPAALLNADLDGNDTLNLGDTAKLYAYVRGTDPVSFVDAAYQLSIHQELKMDCTLSGTVLEIIKPYTPTDPTVTFDLVVPGRENKPIRCMASSDVNAMLLSVGDTVRVFGRLRNNCSVVEMSKSCRLLQWDDLKSTEEDMIALIERARNEELNFPVNITGKVSYWGESYPPESNAVDLDLQIGPYFYSVFCPNAVGELQDKVTIGSTVTVNGYLDRSHDLMEDGAQIIAVDMELPDEMETDPVKIIDMAYGLEDGDYIPYPVTLDGTITQIDSICTKENPYIFVTITVPGREDFPVYCPELIGSHAGNQLCVGDTVSISGMLQRYSRGIHFDNRCQLVDWQPCGIKIPTDPKKIVDAAFQLETNESLPYVATLTGTVKSINESYDDIFENITVTITVQSSNGPKDIVCSWLSGEGVDRIQEGDVITVTGIIEHYYSEDHYPKSYIRFYCNCWLDAIK